MFLGGHLYYLVLGVISRFCYFSVVWFSAQVIVFERYFKVVSKLTDVFSLLLSDIIHLLLEMCWSLLMPWAPQNLNVASMSTVFDFVLCGA